MSKSIKNFRLSICIIILLNSSIYGTAQSAYQYLDSASVAYCRGNIRHSIVYLEQFIKKFPESVLIDEVKFRVGELYQELRDYSNAILTLKSVLTLKEKNSEKSYEDFDEGIKYQPDFGAIILYFGEYRCPAIVKSEGLKALKYKACAELYEIYLHKQEFDSSIYYLNIANRNFFPNTGCGNGNAIIETQIALKFADVYLLKADTIGAIKHLFPVFFYQEGRICENARDLLGDLLKKSYSKERRNQILDQAISKVRLLKTVHDGEVYYEPYFSIFDTELNLWGENNRTVEEFQSWLRTNPYLQKLR